MNALECIQNGRNVNPYINASYSRLKIHDRINKAQRERKRAELPTKSMRKVLLKLFKAVVNELKNSLSTLVE